MGKTEKDIASEDRRLEESNMPEESKKKIREFLTDRKINNASNDQIIYYGIHLRQLATLMGDVFLKPSENDLRSVLAAMLEGKIGNTKQSTGKYSESSIQAYKIAMKGFYTWLLGEDSEIIRWIRIGSRKNRGKKPVEPLTESAVRLLADSATNQRDSTLIWLLYDSGCRIGEILTLMMKDVRFDPFTINGENVETMRLSVTGKTGWRQVRIIGNSVNEMKKWLKQYPMEAEDESWIFPVLEGETKGKPMQETNVRGILKGASRRSGIKGRVYAHLFRHTRATILAGDIAQAPLSDYMGWTQGSSMAKIYVHTTSTQQDDAIIGAYRRKQIEKKDEGKGE